MKWLLIVVAVLGCKKSEDASPIVQPVDPNRPADIPAGEIKRGDDACAALVKKVCDCEGSASDACKLANGQVEAVGIARELANSATATHRDILQSQDSVRKTYAHCIEEATKPLGPCGSGGKAGEMRTTTGADKGLAQGSAGIGSAAIGSAAIGSAAIGSAAPPSRAAE